MGIVVMGWTPHTVNCMRASWRAEWPLSAAQWSRTSPTSYQAISSRTVGHGRGLIDLWGGLCVITVGRSHVW